MNAIQIERLSKNFGTNPALSDISFNIPKGSIFGLLGPNGAGKTTLIRIINQILHQDKGEVYIYDQPITSKAVQNIGYLPEERGLFPKDKIINQATYFAQLKGLSKKDAQTQVLHWLKKLDIENWKNKKVEELSKGMAQKIQFIICLLHNPDIIILDEPFSGFDPVNAEIIKQEIKALKEQGKTIILSTHNMNSVEEMCDDIALIDQSKLVLNDSLNSVKTEYSSGEYAVRFKGNMMTFANCLWADYELVAKKNISKDEHIAYLKLKKGNQINDLLAVLIKAVEIVSVTSEETSMDSIFIQATKQEA